jgi:cyclase
VSDLLELAPGVFAYVQPDGSWFINNTGVVCGRDQLVCIDACATEARTREFLTATRAVSDQSVRVLVNTHHHPDHTNGNGLLGAPVIAAHSLCRAEMAQMAGPPPPGVFDPVTWGQIDPRLPNLCFEERLDLHTGGHHLTLLHHGTPAHTTNDVVVWLPEQRILFAGDLAFNGGTPFALSGSVSGWLEVLWELERLGPDIVVPGHGPVGGPELLRQTGDYLRFVEDAAGEADRQGLSALEAARQLKLGRYAALSDRERIVGNLQRALVDLGDENGGAAIDHVAVFADMVAFNGGQPLRCVA